MPSHRDRSRASFSLLTALLVALSAALLSAVGLFDPVEDALTTHRAKVLTRQPTGETVIVEIDARSLAELRSWPWPRRYHAEVVQQLSKSGASIIAFDVDFSARSVGGDEELARAIRESGNVILPIFEQKWSGRRDERRVVSSRPDAALSDAWVGGVNIFPDADGVVREYPAATFIDGTVQPSIATLLAEKNGLGDRSFQPDWAIDANQIPRFSFVEVMHGRVPAQALHGKRILIGATAIELGDRYAIPRYGVVPGVVVQALATESLLLDRPIQRTGFAATMLGILLIAFTLRPRPIGRPSRHAALCLSVITIIVATPTLVQHLWPVSIDSAAWLFTALIATAVQEGLEARRRLWLRERFDADSGLPNRTKLEKDLGEIKGDQPVLITAGIERFEAIRDGIGLAATNDMVRQAAEIISKFVSAPVYRIAPDILACTIFGEDDASLQAILKRIQFALREPVRTQGGPVDVTLTLGLARNDDGQASVLLIEQALAAITAARSSGKSHAWYRGADPQLRRQLSLMGELRNAMERGRLRLAYQPKMALSSGRIGDAEALVRWVGANGENISPDEFIPLAEATGVIREVTRFALRTAAADMTNWARDGVFVRVAVNVSALDLAAQTFAEDVSRILDEFDLPPSQLALEITESALMRSPAEAIATLNKLRARGIRLSVDDYGTGQSTLSYVKELPVHELKIDKSFVTALASSESDAIMVRSTVNLAHELGLQVVAEGIEDAATLDILGKMGCDYAQGYFISKPVEARDFCRLVSKRGDARRVA